ncbi:hypothetical protein QJS10_CPB04g01843 [Acorus calamus]|uniref:Uncharacterized protein n=1 Tax=Acorus calamus TaxID=4465 RepID=A0AAV9F3H7_ACOCL|nr:hypothetical protein QJS10_CPB04g01843 [Acorus calamus]
MVKEVTLQEQEKLITKNKKQQQQQQSWRVMIMDRPELSLGPSLSKEGSNNGSSASEDDTMGCRKRKCNWDEPTIYNNIELQLKDPLPLDWEQCLDLQYE